MTRGKKRKRAAAAVEAPRHGPGSQSILAAYGLTVAAFFIASFFPEQRTWGINVWAYFPMYVRAGLVTAAIVWGVVAYRISAAADRGDTDANSRTYLWATASVAGVSLAAYVVFRAQYYFLGDGYTVLSHVADNPEYGKWRSYGSSHLVSVVRGFFNGDPEVAALVSFQSVAIVSGAIYLAATWLSARQLFQDLRERFWFLAAFASFGFVILFFGYVEYYASFIAAVTIFGFVGLLAARGRVSRWWIVPPLVVAVYFHVLGATLVPAAAYLLVSRTRLSAYLSSRPIVAKVGLMVGSVIVIAAMFAHFWSTSYFFRFAILPPWPDRFTRFEATLFSPTHLADLANLFILLVPGLVVLGLAAMRLPWRQLLRTREHRFLLMLILGTLGAGFIFDAKLGLARDWDLFSFVGPPIALFLFTPVLHTWKASGRQTLTVALAMGLGVLMLTPRVAVQISGGRALARYTDYIYRDRRQSRTGYVYVMNYLQEHGRSQEAVEFYADWVRRYPEIAMIHDAKELRKTGHVRAAIDEAYAIINVDPRSFEGWSHLAEFYLVLGDLDSGMITAQVARGLNPDNPNNVNNLATSYLLMGRPDEAVELYLKAADLDSLYYSPYYNLAHVADTRGDRAEYLRYMKLAASCPGAAPRVLVDLADYYLTHKDVSRACGLLRQALERGGDASLVRDRERQYPGLDNLLNRQSDTVTAQP